MLEFKGYSIPLHTQAALSDYIEKGLPVGGFLYAVLSNNLVDAVCKADAENSRALKEIVNWLYNEAPHNCHGSAALYLRWITEKPLAMLKPAEVE